MASFHFDVMHDSRSIFHIKIVLLDVGNSSARGQTSEALFCSLARTNTWRQNDVLDLETCMEFPKLTSLVSRLNECYLRSNNWRPRGAGNASRYSSCRYLDFYEDTTMVNSKENTPTGSPSRTERNPSNDPPPPTVDKSLHAEDRDKSVPSRSGSTSPRRSFSPRRSTSPRRSASPRI
ncbi:unnamed protein product [Microthlaspi erraticum]|uniref:Uncharacterized protein n=1 Tax=Microthlaspi erraticum TaxID=1685480 RepID=A0A6D2K667_9BRAS|nr:unnamed protein product [Microthlaspi erraticum]